MRYFDFHHHHHFENEVGIYNLGFLENRIAGFFSAGIHPNRCTEVTDEHFVWLSEISKNPNCLAIGECGLDGLINGNDQIQEALFQHQIELANERNKPLIIHCVRRFSQLIHFQKLARVPMVIHGFNKRKSIGDELQKHDFYLSFGKSVLQNVNLQEFVKYFPTEKLFLETDAEDFNIELLYLKVAELKGIKMGTLIQQIEKNLKIFNIPIDDK
jgi:TatD DNase family protein